MSINNVSEVSAYTPKIEELKPQQQDVKTEKVNNDGAKIASEVVVTDFANKTQAAESEKISTADTQAKIKTAQEDAKTEDKETRVDADAVNKAIDLINQKVMLKSTSLIFEFDDLGDPPVVKVVDKENGEVIREIPPKEMQEIAKAMSDIADNIDSSTGILFNSKI